MSLCQGLTSHRSHWRCPTVQPCRSPPGGGLPSQLHSQRCFGAQVTSGHERGPQSDLGTLGLRIFDPEPILEVNKWARLGGHGERRVWTRAGKARTFRGAREGRAGVGPGGGPGGGAPRSPGGSSELQEGFQATRAACKPLLALLGADSPSLSHLFPFRSPPTCLPPLLPGRQLL